MIKPLPLFTLIFAALFLSACGRMSNPSSDQSLNNGTTLTDQTETISSVPPVSETGSQTDTSSSSPQSDQDILNELNGQADLSLDSDLTQLESELQ